jgi:hypothetical protein
MAERASKVPVEKFSSERSERRKVFEPKAAAGGLARAGHPATIGGQKGNQTRQGPVRRRRYYYYYYYYYYYCFRLDSPRAAAAAAARHSRRAAGVSAGAAVYTKTKKICRFSSAMSFSQSRCRADVGYDTEVSSYYLNPNITSTPRSSR